MGSLPPRRTSRLPDNSVLFDRIIPAVLILFGLLLVLIVVFSVGVLTGIVHIG